MDCRIKIRSSFVPDIIHKEFYTGGNVQLSRDGSQLLCQCRNYVAIVDINLKTIRTIPSEIGDSDNYGDELLVHDDVQAFCVSETEDFIATYHRSGLIKLWNWSDGTVFKSWKSIHKGPVLKLTFNSTNTYLATGGADSSVRIWEIDTMANVFKLGNIDGIIRILAYHVVKNQELLFTSGDEGKIFIWKDKQLVFTLHGHYTVITKLIFSNDGLCLMSCGRDKVATLWDLTDGKKIHTMLLYESLETGTILPSTIRLPGCEEISDGGILIAVGGETGNIRILNISQKKELYKHNGSPQNPLVHLIYNKQANCLISVTADETITLYSLADEQFSVYTQFSGCNDEVLDAAYIGENESHVAVAVNSCNISIYDQHMNVAFLNGHTDLVISLCVSRAFPNLLVSGSKDNSIRVWQMQEGRVHCVASSCAHTASVTAVDMSNISSELPFIVSGSEDTTIKLWRLKRTESRNEFQLNVFKTQIAHDKTVNGVAISPNNKLLASASQDKTAKLWSAADLSLIGILRGHRRGVLCVKFSPVDQVVLTSSVDASIRLWSVKDCSCLKTLEDHESSVLKCVFINNGIQIVSAGSDGLLKIWLIKSGECIATLDKHEGKIWAMAVKSDGSQIISGASDSRIVFWRDNTEEALIKETNAKKELATQEQALMNLLHANQLLPALRLTLTLDRPRQALKILQDILSKDNNGLKDIVTKLDTDQKGTLLNYSCSWNTNSKYCYVAQTVLCCLKDELLDGSISISNKALEGALAYTDRHFKRITKLLQDAQFISYTERMIKPHAS